MIWRGDKKLPMNVAKLVEVVDSLLVEVAQLLAEGGRVLPQLGPANIRQGCCSFCYGNLLANTFMSIANRGGRSTNEFR